MTKDQEYTPKYWIGHNTDHDGVFLATASKSKDNCRLKMTGKVHTSWEEHDNLVVDLFEIKMVEL